MDPLPDGCANQYVGIKYYTAWQLIKSYWRSKQFFPASIFTAIIAILTISCVSLEVTFTYWYYFFYGVLQGCDQQGVARFILVCFALMLYYFLYSVYGYYKSRFFNECCRRWLFKRLVKCWLEKKVNLTTYHFQSLRDELTSIINYSVDLAEQLISAITTFLILLYILWQLSSDVTFSLGPLVPNSLMLFSIACIMFGIYYTCMICCSHAAKEFCVRNARQQGHRLPPPAHWKKLWEKMVSCFSACYNQAYMILPLLFVMPTFFDEIFLLGWFVQSLQAFNHDQKTLLAILNSYLVVSGRQVVQLKKF